MADEEKRVAQEDRASSADIVAALKESGISFVPPSALEPEPANNPEERPPEERPPYPDDYPDEECHFDSVSALFDEAHYDRLIEVVERVAAAATKDHKRVVAGFAKAIVYQLQGFRKACERANFNPFPYIDR